MTTFEQDVDNYLTQLSLTSGDLLLQNVIQSFANEPVGTTKALHLFAGAGGIGQ